MPDDPKSRESNPAPAGPRPGQLTALLQELAHAPERDGDRRWDVALTPGAVIGRFELVRELGRGGFGFVWEAKDRELGRTVAFKAVSGRPEVVEERLLREAESAARLSHPNIVTLFDVGRSEHGPYLVLELLQGRTLEERLSDGRLSVREAVRVALEIAKGVSHAHTKGVVHRDLKPANVFLCDDGQVKVLDFGLAHAFGQRRLDGGTPAYMAPEQWEGAPEDERTDVFAMGVLLYRLLSGDLPFPDDGGKSAQGPRPAPMLDAPELPALGELVTRMLQKRAVQRPRDGGAVAAALRSVQAELEQTSSTGAAPVTTRPRAGLRWLPPRRARFALLVGIVALLAAVPGLVYYVGFRQGAPPRPVADAEGRVIVAVADVVNETGEKELDVLSGLLVTSLEQSRKLSVMTQARVLDLALRAGRKNVARVDETVGREVAKAHGAGALLLPAVRRLGAIYSLEMRAIDPTRDRHLFTVSDRATSKDALLDVLDRLSERTRNQLGEGTSEIAGASVQLGQAVTRSLEAYQHYVAGLEAWLRDGHRAVGLRHFEEAVRIDPEFAAAHMELWSLYTVYGRGDLAAPHAGAAREHLARMPDKEQLLVRLAFASESAGGGVGSAGKVDVGEAIRLAASLEARFPDDKFVLVRVATAYLTPDIDRREDAARVLHRALALDPALATAGRQLIWMEAQPTARLEIARRAVAARRNASTLYLLAEAELAAGAREAAVEAAREALRLDGTQNSVNIGNACWILESVAGRPVCASEWRKLLASGPNEFERDFARFQLVVSLAVEGRRAEAQRLAGSVPDRRQGDPLRLARALSVGMPRAGAVEARDVARRIVDPYYRAYMTDWLGGAEEPHHPRPFTPLEEQFIAPLRLARLGKHDDAAAIQARNRDWAHEHEHDSAGEVFLHAYLLAEQLLAAGRIEEAAAVEARVPLGGSTWILDRAENGPRLALVRARAMAKLGRDSDAVRELDGVIAFWKDAEPDLPLLVEAKSLRSRLAKASRTLSRPAVTSAESGMPRSSIAVLPFSDLSPGKDQEYFADGVAEEILNALAGVRGLSVAGRTSSFSFKGRKDDLQSIGARLGVAHVLEGSVRRDGGQVRVTVRLVKAADGYRVWSETYDRALTGIFALQDEVARAVAARVAPVLAGAREGVSAGVPTTSPEAYQEVLRGRDLARRESMEGLRDALAAFVRASQIDPGFAPAWAGRARVTFRLMAMEDGFEEARLGHARSAAERAIALAPQLAEGYLARAMLRRMEFNWAGAEADVARALAQGPGNAEALTEHCLVLRAVGRLPEAIAACQSAVTLDPLHARSWYLLGDALKSAGDLTGARGALERSLQIAPDATHTPYLLTVVLVAANAPLEAMNVARAGRPWVRDFAAAVALHSLGRTAESRTILARAEGRQARGDGELNATADAYQIAEAYAWIGDNDRAFTLLETAIRNHDMGVGIYLRHSPLLAGLRGDARWKPLLRKLNLPE